VLRTFRGGVHPPEHKERTRDLPVKEFPPPERVVLLLSQHIGAPCRPTVNKGDRVRTGQVVGEPQGFVSAPVHSSVTGKVAAVDAWPNPVTGARTPAVIVEREGDDEWAEGTNLRQDASSLGPDEIKARVRAAGIVGLGGAAFPTHVKLSPPPDKPIDTAILNGAECEPYLTADHRLMVEEPEAVLEGFRLIMRALGCGAGIVAIEANKPEAFEAMCRAASGDRSIRVELLKVKYPQGAEHQLIKALLGREIPWRGGLPMAVGALVQNVGTAYAVYEAVHFARPLIRRILTVTGDVFGGPMMGIAQRHVDLPVTKGTSGVLVLTDPASAQPGPCIRCGRCVRACPYGLTPAAISRAIENLNFEAALEWFVLECKECGCCTYVCPAKRPIVHQVKFAKAEIAKQRRREQEKAASGAGS